jgi:HEAT repeat protein
VWRFAALLLALVAGVGAAVWYYRAPQAGAPVRVAARNDDRWLDDLQSHHPQDVERGTSEVEARGTAALPLIRQTLQDPDAEPARRIAALKACAILGVRAAEAIPDIAELLTDDRYAAESALALSFMGSAAVSTLRDALNDDSPIVRKEALRSLGKVRERASIDPQLVVPALVSAIDDPEGDVREIAATYLGIVRDMPQVEVPALLRALTDESPSVRRAAATALAGYGKQGEAALPGLRKATSDPDEDVRREAGRAIITINDALRQ